MSVSDWKANTERARHVKRVRLTPVPLCRWRTGLRCRYMLGKRTIICESRLVTGGEK
jgi:hypothetical protein